MGIKLENVVPWGRSMAEYVKMFHLTHNDLKLKILDCASGPASFNAQMSRQGYQVVSCDPIYQFSASEIHQRIQQTYPQIIGGLEKNLQNYIWEEISSPKALGEIRMAAMRQFLEDFSLGLHAKRYLPDSLPTLTFDNNQFDLALCSHFLFTYSDHFSTAFHIDAIVEMCRVATQVRIFPLLNISGEVSFHLQPVLNELQQQGYQTEIQQALYEFQRGGNEFLRVSKPVIIN